MGFPIVSEIWDGIRWIIDFFIDKAPQPLKILFFLLFLVGFVAMIPFFIHVFGLHCNTTGEVIKVSPIKVITNVRLAFMGKDDIINSSSYIPEKPNLLSTCRFPVCYVNGTYYWQSDNACDGETIIYPYLMTRASWSWCGYCQGNVTSIGIESSLLLGTDYNYVCLDDVNHIPVEERNWYQKWICDEGDDCTVPNHYKYEFDTGTFDCIDLDICGENNSVITSAVDDLLEESAGELFYDSPETKDYKHLLTISCNKELSPNIYMFGNPYSESKSGIPIFDYRIWLFLIIIYVMFMFLGYIKQHSG